MVSYKVKLAVKEAGLSHLKARTKYIWLKLIPLLKSSKYWQH